MNRAPTLPTPIPSVPREMLNRVSAKVFSNVLTTA